MIWGCGGSTKNVTFIFFFYQMFKINIRRSTYDFSWMGIPRGGTPILWHGREVPWWWPSFLRFSIRLGALFSILKPLKQPGSIWLTTHCVDIQSNWPPLSQFSIQLTPFFWTLSDHIGSIFQACAEPPYQNFCRVPADQNMSKWRCTCSRCLNSCILVLQIGK